MKILLSVPSPDDDGTLTAAVELRDFVCQLGGTSPNSIAAADGCA